jgi:CubicO group peptidase (beta-lactamase class C family)
MNLAPSAIHGHCEHGFEAVADVLADNLRSGSEIGASIGVYQAGRPVVRIWGGLADRGRGVSWGEQTLTPIASVTKALATVALLSLVDRGLIDLDKPVATYWPGFGQNGKADIPVHLVLSQRSGVAALDTAVSNDQAAALDPVLRQIERQRPWWRPGTRHGYHAITYGFIISGLVRAVTGRTVGRYFAEEIAAPLGLDLYIGLPSALHSLVAPMVGPSQVQAIRAMLRPVWLPYVLGLLNRRSASYRATFGGSAAGFNDTEELIRYEVEDPSAGAVGNGSSLARLFAALIGPVDGRRLISESLMNSARQIQTSGRDVVLRMRTNWGLGFLLPGGPMWPDVGVPGLFGFPGASGSLAFADPEHQLAFGYTPSRWAELSGTGAASRFRFETYTAAVYEAAGIRRWPRSRPPRRS